MNDLDKANKEYLKNKELSKEDVQILKEWMQKQPHLPNITEFQIILFLHSCYYRLEPTKACIENFYTAKAHCPEFFQNRNPRLYASEIFDTSEYIGSSLHNGVGLLDLLVKMLISPVSRRTPEGYQILFVKFLNFDPSRFVLQHFFKSLDMGAMLCLRENGTAPGHIILADVKGMVFNHVARLNPTFLMKFFFYLQEALPFRLKGLYYYNIPSFMDKVILLFKPYIKSELMSVLKLFPEKSEELYKLVPRECFPSDYGGQTESISELIEKRKQAYLKNEQFFVDGEKEIADESKRVGKPKHDKDVFGVEGTFKKLEID